MEDRKIHRMPLKIVEKPVPFRKGEGKQMYCLKPDGAHPLDFADKVVRRMEMYGCPRAWARLSASVMGEVMRSLLSEGHAVNIEGLGTFRLSVNSKAHDTPMECSPSDVRKRKLQFYPSKETQAFLEDCTFHICNRKEFIDEWKKKRKK